MLPSDKLTILIPHCGTLMGDFFNEMVKLSQEKSEDVYGEFNGAFYIVRSGESTPRFWFNMIPVTDYPTYQNACKTESQKNDWIMDKIGG